jgi:hypothetical protein
MSNGFRENGFWRVRLLAVALTGSLALVLSLPSASALAAGCTRVAALSGSDTAPGTESQPFRSVQKLVDSLSGGEVGCVRAGTYSGNVKITRSGSAGAPLSLTSFPGERATVAGKLWVTDTANFVTVSSLDLDGRNDGNLPSPAVNGDDVSFLDNDVTNHNTTICFNLGATTYGRAYRTLIQRNRIHNCGELPATNLDHGIYAEHTTDARILDNAIYDNADRGVQLYPDAQGTHVARNVIDGNGEGVLIGGGSEDYGPQASSDSVIEQNIITFSSQRYNVESHWGSPAVGERNVVRNNCVFGGARDPDNHGLSPANGGFSATNNLLADPGFVNRPAKDFGLRADSPCRDLANLVVPGGGASVGRPTITLTSGSAAVLPGHSVPLSGRVTGGRHPKHISLKVRRGKRWTKVRKVRVRKDGRFSTRARLRGKSSKHGLKLSSARVSRRAAVLRLSASAAGYGRSNTVLVRIR